MSCCGCASRVLKLQSEIRSWKTKLGDEKREKKMILKWIMAVFGYDAKVEIDRESRIVRLQATENKEAMAKAIIKSGISGNEEDCGVMVMEVKLEDNEYFEPFEEPYDVPEFPILEINSMTTTNQIPPLVSTGITGFGNLSQFNPQSLSITTPMEVTATPLSVITPNDPEVLYIAGDLEAGATLEGPNGQSYIIVGANETGQNLPLQMDYSAVVNDNANVIFDSNNVMLPSCLPVQEPVNALGILPPPPKPVQIPQVTPLSIPTIGIVAPEPPKKTSLSSVSASKNMKSSKKKPGGAMQRLGKFEAAKSQSDIPSVADLNLNANKIQIVSSGNVNQTTAKNDNGVFGLTMREKAEVFVLQKAREAVEKVGSGFRCTVCNENRYLYSSYDIAISHIKTHFESKPYKCGFCDDLFGTQKELLNHRKTVHSKSKGATTSIKPNISSITLQLPKKITSTINKTKKCNPNSSTATIPLRISSSYSGTTINSGRSNTSGSCNNIINSSTKTIKVQAPFDNFVSGPISITNDVLAEILRSSGATNVVFSSQQ